MKKLSVITRLLIAVGSLALIAAIYLPIWRIDLTAPQYPEGLYMTICADKVGGDVNIINGLNHYIGMKTIHADEFVEFTVLPYIIWLLVVLGLTTAIANRRKLFNVYFTLFVVFAFVAMADFYRWEYNYGHDLNPEAPIQVPGMAYQPPLIGYKQLLNFSAYSFPDQGGWGFIAGGVLFAAGLGFEIYRNKRQRKLEKKTFSAAAPAAIAAMMIVLLSCTSGPEAIRFGKDPCDHCKMTVMDKHFGGELVTTKGKVFHFDDIRCIADYMNSDNAAKTNSTVYFLDYNGNGNLINADSAFLMKSDALRSPMGGNYAAFKDATSRDAKVRELNGSVVNWADLVK